MENEKVELTEEQLELQKATSVLQKDYEQRCEAAGKEYTEVVSAIEQKYKVQITIRQPQIIVS